MATFQKFEDIQGWQKARELTRAVYGITAEGSFARDFGLRDQIRRAAVSILSNIAEGFERDGTREFIQFLSIAKGSAGEVKAQLYVALDQGYLSEADFSRLSEMAGEVGKLLAGLINYLNSTELKGIKYR